MGNIDAGIGIPRPASPTVATGTTTVPHPITGDLVTVAVFEAYPDLDGRPLARMVADPLSGDVTPATHHDLRLCDDLGIRQVPTGTPAPG